MNHFLKYIVRRLDRYLWLIDSRAAMARRKAVTQ